SGPRIVAELDAFSGRPNPTFELSGEEAEEVARRLSGLPPAPGPAPAAGLGYRGFSLTGPARTGFPGRVYVGSGVVELGEPPGALRRDAHDLEGYLRRIASARGLPAGP